jgi:hypothetical protein
MSNKIDLQGRYIGSELVWTTDDVLRIINERDESASREDLERVLIATFQDNYDLMNYINECIAETVSYMDEQQEIKLIKLFRQ